MSEQTSQEPTMEEILASIRRIISEDDAPADAEAAAFAPALEETPEPEPEMVEFAAEVDVALEEDDDLLELNEPVAAPQSSIGDLDVFSAAPAAPEPAPAPQPAPAPAPVAAPAYREDSLVSPPTAMAAASAFHSLAQRVAMPPATQSLDDVVRELLRPLLKEWLDQNLPAIVQAKVEQEVERLARGR